MSRRVRALAGCLLAACLLSESAFAQEDVIAKARAAHSAGRTAEAVSMLEAHLAASPNDVDARLVYGLILSWDGQYDRARTALSAVLTQAPGYLDARVALMNVEFWSGRNDEARTHMVQVLSREPGNTQATLMRQRLDAKTRPWTASASYTYDTFSDDRDPWSETSIGLSRQTPVGSIIVRGNAAERFGLHDRQVDIELYPTFRAGSYAFVGVSFGDDQALYPERRVSVDLYQSIGRGFEVSGGFRRLEFAETTSIYIGTLTKYLGNWMLTGKAFVVPDETVGNSWSYHSVVRRYFGGNGTSFVGVGYSHGFSREEPRGAGDLIRVDADTFRAQAEIDVNDWWRLSVSGSSSRQERALRDALWQTTGSAGLSLRF